MELVKLQPRKRYNTAPVMARLKIINNGHKINLRIKPEVLDLLGIKAGDRLSISYVKENPKILFLKMDIEGNKISTNYRILVNSPFKFENEIKSLEIPYEIKDEGIYLYFDRI